jgi:hypothetical protein
VRSKRIAFVALGATALAVSAVGAAHGAKPDRASAPSSGFSFPPGVVCPFAVEAEVGANRQTQTTFSSGKVAIHGFFEARLLANGNELNFVTPGSIFLTPRSDGLLDFESAGPIIIFFFPGDAGPGDTSTGRTYLFKGHVEIVVDPATFEFLEFAHTGTAEDLCTALA